jgi:K+-sensing histidine kinase KdpD
LPDASLPSLLPSPPCEQPWAAARGCWYFHAAFPLPTCAAIGLLQKSGGPLADNRLSRKEFLEMVDPSLLKNRFFRNILILTAMIIIALMVYNYFLTTPSFTRLLLHTTETDAVRITRHLASAVLISGTEEISKATLNDQLPKEVDKIKKDFELMSLKVFSPSGEIVFSDDPDEMGQVNERRYFQDIVAKGRVYSTLVPKNEESLEGRTMARDVLETYVPLMNKGRFLGALEIYYDITGRKKELDRLISQSSTITFIFASALLVAIVLILYEENVAMKKRRQLEEERLQRERLQGVLEMAGAACHELNQPLQVLSLHSYYLMYDLPQDSPLLEKIKTIKEMTDQLGKITKKIMHITKYETKEYLEGSKIIDIDKASSPEITP